MKQMLLKHSYLKQAYKHTTQLVGTNCITKDSLQTVAAAAAPAALEK
jgi:hypothetical protein